MIIKVLAENKLTSENYESEHGLSLYIETKNHKLLFDTGASALFAQNAKKMEVDLSAVDIVVISHGHYDHGGGLKDFLSINSKAKVYLNEKAFGKYYSNRLGGEKRYIGLDETLLPNERFIFVGEQLVIDEELELFSSIKKRKINQSINNGLFVKVESLFFPDDFSHEQNLIIKEGGSTVLVVGCAHNGIINILEYLHEDKGIQPSHVIGGFHLYNYSAKDVSVLAEIGAYFLRTGSKFYTGHCTGVDSYERLKLIMGEKITYLSTGSQLII